MTVFFLWIVSAIVCGWIGHAIGKGKNLSFEGAVLGGSLGVVGILIVAWMRGRPSTRQDQNANNHFSKQDPFEAFEASENAKSILPAPKKK